MPMQNEDGVWWVAAERFMTADFTAPFRVHSPFQLNPGDSRRYRLKAIRTWFVIYNNPTFTDIALRIYSDRNGSIGKLLGTSESRLKSEIHTLSHGLKEVGFEFDPALSFDGDQVLHLVPVATGYVGTNSSHIGWRRAWEDPVYEDDITADFQDLATKPFHFTVIGERVR